MNRNNKNIQNHEAITHALMIVWLSPKPSQSKTVI
jgi:hypothetical protein